MTSLFQPFAMYCKVIKKIKSLKSLHFSIETFRDHILDKLPQSTGGLLKGHHSFGKVLQPSCKTPTIQVFPG